MLKKNPFLATFDGIEQYAFVQTKTAVILPDTTVLRGLKKCWLFQLCYKGKYDLPEPNQIQVLNKSIRKELSTTYVSCERTGYNKYQLRYKANYNEYQLIVKNYKYKIQVSVGIEPYVIILCTCYFFKYIFMYLGSFHHILCIFLSVYMLQALTFPIAKQGLWNKIR